MLAEDVLRLCGGSAGPDGHDALCQSTPRAEEPDARMKRQRLCNSHDSSGTQVWAGDSASPPAAAAAPPSRPTLPWQASHLLDYVRSCLEGLTRMHETCAFIQTDTKAAEMACAIFRRVYLQRGEQDQTAMLQNMTLAQSLLAASLWVAVKFEANRTTTPDSKIMSRITGIPAAFLRQLERSIMAELNWELMPCAREAGAVGLPDLTDAVCQDQQNQLAALSMPPPPSAPTAAALPAAAAAMLWVQQQQQELAARQLAALLAGQHREQLRQQALCGAGLAAAPANLLQRLLPSPTRAAAQQQQQGLCSAAAAEDADDSLLDLTAHMSGDMGRLWAAL